MGSPDRPGGERIGAGARSGTHISVAAAVRRLIAGLAAREDWYFAGRPGQRRQPADLTGSSLAGIVIDRIGGTGKTTLAAEVTIRVLDAGAPP